MESIFWLVAFVLFTLVEAASVGLTSIWFAVGSLAALISVGFGASVSTQAVICLAVAGSSMLLLRPIAKNYLKLGEEPTNADRIIGKVVLVTQTIDNITNVGEVQVNGQLWGAMSVDDVVIPSQQKVKVIEIRGVRLIVEPVTDMALS